MADGLRTFKCRLAGRDQVVEIVDILVHCDDIYLILVGADRVKRVMTILPSGLRVTHPGKASEVLQLHDVEMLRFRSAQEAASAH